QFHDILPGSSIGAVYEDSDADYAAFFAQARALTAQLAARLAPAGSKALFNVAGRPRGGLVVSPEPFGRPQEQTLVLADGGEAYGLLVPAVPALAVVDLAGPGVHVPAGALSVSERHLENERLSVRFDDAGRIASILDRKAGREVLKPGRVGNRLQAFRDMPAQFDAWDIDSDFEDQVFEIDTLVGAEVVERGPLRAAVRFEWRYESSRIVQVVSLAAGARQVEIDCFIDWREHNTLVKTAFPLDLNTAAVDAEIQFGHVRRASHRNTSWDRARFECSMQRWIDVGEADFGVALLNDCKYGYDAKGTDIRLTLLRSPTYPWPEADQGQHRFRYAVMVHDGDKLAVHEAAEDFNLPLRLIKGGEGGEAPPPLLSVETPGIAVEAVKQAEEGGAIIVRLWEVTGARRTARIMVDPAIRTAELADLLERDGRPLALEDGALTLAFAPFEIVTLMLRG
ncbi:MAG: glycoside hydrolase family 38 C-terminal domain-containing protein, partial [Rhizobiaceae bacterium]|nr:glycoside hydrolase family 38 C-terminal domain-containing protein [Rhizobiaceae bacterium]